ncbi:hypothetical protein CIK81_10285 [Brachybacterium sp. JB7]|uniref:Uncharacterized protein n=1 Tax=Brachybacterium alimentarium TaxID=47845 RepID=A0A2A3YI59_9MICO|nr:hypothetical protein CIK71_10465 [Brachybacterium alimentarium]RCS63958.1 hypothetical protein CIK81_10285 [Brachybacterium sp. JB7]PCC38958.1 hypothetical protein CIK66_11470 [Brachybacterium alimentarium]RCS71994.1 hypothetical protein CIK73_02460 [Brachybacterium alimentarium]RCS75463.1 hypothetical protein CIK68_03745 [Brachybacterium alimentarium]
MRCLLVVLVVLVVPVVLVVLIRPGSCGLDRRSSRAAPEETPAPITAPRAMMHGHATETMVPLGTDAVSESTAPPHRAPFMRSAAWDMLPWLP